MVLVSVPSSRPPRPTRHSRFVPHGAVVGLLLSGCLWSAARAGVVGLAGFHDGARTQQHEAGHIDTKQGVESNGQGLGAAGSVGREIGISDPEAGAHLPLQAGGAIGSVRTKQPKPGRKAMLDASSDKIFTALDHDHDEFL